MRSKKTRIVTESSRTSFLILRNSRPGPTQSRCDDCSEDVVWLQPQAAAELTGHEPGEFSRLLETGSVHTETTSEGTRICVSSLLKNYRERM